MGSINCPICCTELVTKNVTPCMECGGDDFEKEHYKDHIYREYEAYFGQRIVLCDFCDVDFGSCDPVYFGFEKGKRVGYEDFNFVKEINDLEIRKDKYCPKCKHRLIFLTFVQKCRENNRKITQHNI